MESEVRGDKSLLNDLREHIAAQVQQINERQSNLLLMVGRIARASGMSEDDVVAYDEYVGTEAIRLGEAKNQLESLQALVLPYAVEADVNDLTGQTDNSPQS